MRRCAALLLFAATGCSSGFGIELTVVPGCLVGASTIEVQAILSPSGLMQTAQVGEAAFVAGGSRIAIAVPDGTTNVAVTVTARDVKGTALGTGSLTVPVSGHAFTNVTLTMSGPACQDGGAADASDGGMITDCPGFATFCDDFELGNVSRWTRTQTLTAAAAISVTRVRPRSGSWSLEAQVTGTASSGANLGKMPLPLPSNVQTVGVRFHLFLTASVNNGASPLGIGNPTTHYFNIVLNGGNWAVRYYQGTDAQSAIAAPVGVWTCVELVLSNVGAPGTHVQLFADNATVLDYQSTAATTAGELYVGLPQLPIGPAHAFIDDVAVGPQRIGCP